MASLWNRVQNLPQVHSVYGPHFPLELRHFFAAFIESQTWSSINESDESHLASAQQLHKKFLALIAEKVMELSGEEGFLVKHRLEEIATDFDRRYRDNPLNLVRVLKRCIASELELLETAARGQNEQGGANNQQFSVVGMQEMLNLQLQVQRAEGQLKVLQEQQEYFLLKYQELIQLQNLSSQIIKADPSGNGNGLEPEQRSKFQALKNHRQQIEKELAEAGGNITSTRKFLTSIYEHGVSLLNPVTLLFLEELNTWKDQTRLASPEREKAALERLHSLQMDCEFLVNILWQMRQQIRQLNVLQEQLVLREDQSANSLPTVARLATDSFTLLTRIIQSSLIVEKQPPQVLKTVTKFTATVTLLSGRMLNLYLNPPEMKATIVNEQQARLALTKARAALPGVGGPTPANTTALVTTVKEFTTFIEGLDGTTGTMLNDRVSLEAPGGGGAGAFRANFRNLSLKKIKRAKEAQRVVSEKDESSVTEEKFALLFHTTITVGDISFCLYALSTPAIVVVHSVQLCRALATVAWDNFFSTPNREPFVVPDAVPFHMIGNALSLHFQFEVGTPLTPQAVAYLKEKALGNPTAPDDAVLTWTRFSKDVISRRNFTFWEWFYYAMDLVKKYLHGPWCDGLIMGFVGKNRAQDMLLERPPGTFLLRFSDSELGGISVAWMSLDQDGHRKVWHLQPWFAKDLVIRSLADRLGDLPELENLYPDRAKDTVFAKYYTPANEQPTLPGSDYVRVNIAAKMQQVAQPQVHVGAFYQIPEWTYSDEFFKNMGVNSAEFGFGDFSDENSMMPLQRKATISEPIDLSQFLSSGPGSAMSPPTLQGGAHAGQMDEE